MRQLILHGPRQLQVQTDVPPPRPAPGEALVRLRLGGICGSDLSAYRGTSPMVCYPRVLGHELLVEVLQASDRPELQGQRAVVEPLVPCGRCRACRLGRYNCCTALQVLGVHTDGGLRDLAPIPVRCLYPVPSGMADEVAVLAEPLAVAYHAVQRGSPDAGETAVVLGAGSIGLLIAQLLRRARGCRVLVADVNPARLELAERLGAVPLQGSERDWVAQVAAQTDGELCAVVFEATGHPRATALVSELVAAAGRVVLVGWNHAPVALDTVALMRKEVDLRGSRNSAGAFPAVLQLLADDLVDVRPLLTHRFPLEEAAQALALLDQGQGLKVLLG